MVISVQCPSCSTSFPVDPAKVPEGGVNARCSMCSAIFRVEKPAEEEALPIQEFEAPVEASLPTYEDVSESLEDEAFEIEPPEAVEPAVEEPIEPVEPVVEPVEPVVEPIEPVVEPIEPVVDAEEPVAETLDTEESEIPTTPSTDDWVIEREEEPDPSTFSVEPMDTVESTLEEAKDEVDEDEAFFGGDPFGLEASEMTLEPFEEETQAEPSEPAEPELAAPVEAEEEAAAEPMPEPAAPPEPMDSAPPESPPEPEAPAPKTQGFTFGHRDPHDKARRLARVLVSDMIMYNPDRHQRALAGGTLKEDFEDEITKSWKEYVDQVGDEIANGTSYWSDALNDVLAKGEQIF